MSASTEVSQGGVEQLGSIGLDLRVLGMLRYLFEHTYDHCVLSTCTRIPEIR